MVPGFFLLLALAGDPVVETPLSEIELVSDVDVFALDDEMIRFLEETVTSSAPERKLYELINGIFAKDKLNLAYENAKTRTAIETFHSRNGNCLSFTNMFVAMARHVGLDARFQEVYILPTWNKKGEMIFLSRHINAVVELPGRAMEVDFNPWADRRAFSSMLVSDSRAKAQYYNNIAAEFFVSGEYHLAIPWFRKAISIEPALSFAWSNLGVAFRKNEQLIEAERAYLTALEVNKREYTAMTNLARLYDHLGRDKEAKRYEKKAERFRNQNPYYHFSLGNMAYADGSYRNAADHYRDAIRRKNTDHEFHFALAKTYAQLGNMKKAAASLEKAKKFSPDVFNQNKYSQKLDFLAAKK